MPVFPKENPSSPQITTHFDNSNQSVAPSAGENGMIANTPILTPTNVIELSAVGMGVAPESTISPSQALALAKRAAIVDGYRQLGEKMYGIRVNATDTVKDMILQNSVIKTKVNALIRNAEITETIYKDGLCQVSMELKLDGRIWYNVFNRARG
ncbi:Lipoprotein [Helicobacter sp. NHP19-003]|uniref:Lipoprotein n=2 Tax=Helicobacter gastrocanis TaxID=2849641 RepID=A0ABM7SFP1_9HELI|nr:Lipoprotein [Helicobacter sp. NHP19-003]